MRNLKINNLLIRLNREKNKNLYNIVVVKKMLNHNQIWIL